MIRILFALALLSGGFCYGQNQLTMLVTPAGGSFQNSSFSTQWTLGEIVGGTKNTKNLYIQQGFLHPSVTLGITGLEKSLSTISLNIYPNPANDFLNVQGNTSIKDIKYKLFDSKGVLLETWGTENALQVKKLDISDYVPGIYLLIVDSPSFEQNLKFKIIKTYTHE